MAAATYLFFVNIVGQIIGPFIVGYLNDQLQSQYGDVSIRYSLIVGAVCAALAGIGFLFASPSYPNDVRRAESA